MAATFNSFIHPFIIMLTVPLALFGGLVFILFLNSSINIFSQIALVILIGISTKNSILIVDYANQLRTAGKKRGSSPGTKLPRMSSPSHVTWPSY